MPKFLVYILLVVLILAMIPPALIARTRAVPNERRRIHFIQDMDNQPRFKGQQENPLFADRRAMRAPIAGTVARGRLDEDDAYFRGAVNLAGKPAWSETFPSQAPLTMDLLRRGQDRYDIYCRVCHGDAGYGDGIVHHRAMELVAAGVNGTTWVQPKSLHDPEIRVQPPGQLFNTITHGIRNMPSYESQISVADRWAIVAYVKALQRSQHANLEDVPASQRSSLPLIRLVEPGTGTGEEGARP